MKRTYKQAPFDEEFRKNVARLLDLAEREVLVITGEGSSYQYQELRWGMERARERGVDFKIYCVRPRREYVNKALQLGCEVYVGEQELDEHYLIVDGKHCMTSAIRPRAEIGKRAGEIRMNDEQLAREKAKLFSELISKSKKEEKMRVSEDPLWKLVHHPIDFGYDTHSEKFEEEL